MSMQDSTAIGKSCIGAHYLPGVRKHGNALVIFILLQVYFTCNILSFGFWKSGLAVFAYLALFYGVWLVGLVLLLSFGLMIGAWFGKTRFDPVILIIFSLPLCFGLWLQTWEVRPDTLWWVAIPLIAVMFVYYRFGVLYSGGVSVLMVSLCLVSFLGHADIFAAPDRFSERVSADTAPPDTGIVSLDRKTNIHVIMFDSLTHSAFSENWLGVRNPAADYLSTLDDTIDAGITGFAERVPTRNSWATLFELERERGNHRAFSGRAPSFLTDLLRKNGYYIQTGYHGSYFGAIQGEHVDRYIFEVVHLEDSLICAAQVPLLGFCSELSRTIYRNWFRSPFRQTHFREWPREVISLIDQAEREITGPIFSAFHIYSPVGHTSNTHLTNDLEMVAEYRKLFINQTRRAKRLMEEINHLRKRFPDSIFIVSGDHGPYLSRTEEEDRRFIVLDRHAIALSLLNATNLCPWSINWLEKQRYLTPGRMLAASLACDGESRKLTEHFRDNEEFIRFGESLDN